MTRDQATREARKRWGAKAQIQAYERQSSPERRDAAREQLHTTRDRIKAIDAEIAERLQALDWYRALTTERQQLRLWINQNGGNAAYHRFSVGTSSGGFFLVRGEGDTWEEAFADAADYDAREAARYAQPRTRDG